MKVVVTSDHHSGYANADKAAFNTFLDNISQEGDVTHLVPLLKQSLEYLRRNEN